MWNESLYKLYFIDKNKYHDVYNKRIESENTYLFNFEISQNKAFFFYHKDIMKMVSNISKLDKIVTNILNVLPPVAQTFYIKKSLIDEILYTNEIEGVISTRKEINEILDKISDNVKIKQSKITSLINKYKMLLEQNHGNVNNCNEIRKIYDDLVLYDIVSNDPEDTPDGVIFRKNGVEVKNERSGRVMHEGVMPEAKIIDMMSDMINFINDASVEPLIRIAIFHYVFSYIHPFYDGNGRTNRFISSLYLKMNYNPIIAFRLSLTIKENKKQYDDAFDNTNSNRNNGDISTFVYEFLNIIEKAYEKTVEYLTVKQKLLIEAENKIINLPLSKTEKDVLYLLSQVEIFKGEKENIRNISSFIKASEPTTRNAISNLIQLGYVSEEKQGKYKLYSLVIKK